MARPAASISSPTQASNPFKQRSPLKSYKVQINPDNPAARQQKTTLSSMTGGVTPHATCEHQSHSSGDRRKRFSLSTHTLLFQVSDILSLGDSCHRVSVPASTMAAPGRARALSVQLYTRVFGGQGHRGAGLSKPAFSSTDDRSPASASISAAVSQERRASRRHTRCHGGHQINDT